jgi:hypothetical protein
VDAPVIPVGFMLEADWDNGARWLGLLFRRKLTVAELDLVNVETWPELKDLEAFMDRLFNESWSAEGEGLGSAQLAMRYPAYSALHFATEPLTVRCGEFNRAESFQLLYGMLLGYEERLHPVVTAAVLPFGNAKRPVTKPHEPVEMMNKAA